MDTILQGWQEREDRRAAFLHCYRMMTGNMFVAVEDGEFHDAEWVGRMLQHFAGYYFKALEGYEQGAPDIPAAWALAHDAEAFVLQNMLLGINAHINYDLVLVLYDMLQPEWERLPEARRRERYEDHCYVNVIIGETIDAAQDQIVEVDAPVMDLVDKLLGPLDEWSASLMIRSWREEVWQNALEMVAAQEEGEREALRRRIEQVALERGKRILRPAGTAWFKRAQIVGQGEQG